MIRFFEYRASTLSERKQFYSNEFSLSKVKKWFKGRKLPQICAVDAGSETNIIKNKKLKGKMLYFKFSEIIEKIRKYAPEDVYYDRNQYKNPDKAIEALNFKNFTSQELVFDIDSDNIKCSHSNNQVCGICIEKAYQYSLDMMNELKKKFKKIKLVYSGRGFHIHVLDKKTSILTIKQRPILVKKFLKYPIDPWVSRGYISLIRMPYTLNGLVSRIVTPINKKGFSEKIKRITMPKFLRN